GYGRPLWLMHGFYKANGGCGYINKTDFLLKNGPSWPLFAPISSQQIGIAVVPADTTMNKTKAVEDIWTLVWSEDRSARAPKSRKNDFAGLTCLAVSEFR
ncbi:phosphoinositide phospholipase C 2-like, partial [Curcuma longa]|uniref:phosphoinositide phospholipase C 2-like n=1 Tax=Curcuma longa TaxID=136217 RepID=UPI003D9DD91A